MRVAISILTTLISMNIHAAGSGNLSELINGNLKLQRGLNTLSSPIMYVGRDLMTNANESRWSGQTVLLG